MHSTVRKILLDRETVGVCSSTSSQTAPPLPPLRNVLLVFTITKSTFICASYLTSINTHPPIITNPAVTKPELVTLPSTLICASYLTPGLSTISTSRSKIAQKPHYLMFMSDNAFTTEEPILSDKSITQCREDVNVNRQLFANAMKCSG